LFSETSSWGVEASVVKSAEADQTLGDGGVPVSLMLSGVCEAKGDGGLRGVGTALSVGASLDLAGAGSSNLTKFEFTRKTWLPSVSVKNGQLIAANVEFTFE
jgi:hypothetical protein